MYYNRLFKSNIVQIYDKFISSPPEKKYSVIKPDDDVAEYILGKRKAIDFKTTKAYIEKPVTDPLNIQWMVAEIPQQKERSLDCGVFMAAFAEYVCIGDLSINPFSRSFGYRPTP
ncbi:uncharacterized protein LOC107781697 isoform X1 [Nicotiana tabacum]|uniref:Uncharacterized protein LOC107781697 isoform X1 n=3 Tax=Nicotiana tabacum TaxID=4097 RepID=A0A1S3Z027_TOBAC|nr:PREDICTED: uncharacterized protein LOC107781697 isoform X1 [Nicotiana tabacum]